MAILLSIEFNDGTMLDHFTSVCGLALKNSKCKLNQTAQRLGLLPMLSFFHKDEEQWFEKKLGLTTIQGLLKQLRQQPFGVCSAERSIADLEIIEQILLSAKSEWFRFNVASVRS
jgi:hypothetical protein